jgi:signal transduction histidine kinase
VIYSSPSLLSSPMKPFTICVLLAFTFLDLTPFIFNYELIHNRDCQLFNVLQTQLSLVTFVFAAASMTPLAVDVLCYVFHRDKFFLLERSILLVSCAFPSVLAIIRTHPRSAEVFVCLNSIQSVWSVAALANGMKKSDSKFFRSSLCDAFYFLAACNQGLVPFVELKGDKGLYFLYLSNIFFVFAVVLLIYMYIGYLRDMWIGASDVSKDVRANEYLPLICSSVILIFVVAFTGFVIGFNVTYLQDMNQTVLCFMIFITCGIAIVSTLLPGRIARTQVREIESNLEIKRSFVRYIGHEIRTPLNIASIGLDLLSSMDLLQLAEEAAYGHQQLNSIVNSMDDNMGDVRKEYALENMERAESQDTYDSNFPAMYPAINNGITPRTRGDMRSSAYKTSLRQASVQSQKVIEQQQTAIQDMDKIITEVRNAVNLGTKVLNDLLAYDKLDSNNLMLEKSVVALEDLAHATLGMFAVQASSKAIKFEVEVSIASCSVRR